MRTACCRQAQLDVAASQECCQLSVAAAEVEDDGERVVLLGVRDEEVQEEALAASRRAEHQRVPDVLMVQVVVEGHAVGRLERGQRARQRARARRALGR